MGPSIINFTIHSSTTMYCSTATEIQCCIPTVLWVFKPKVSSLIHVCHCCDFEDEYNHTPPGGGWPRVQNEILMAVLLLFSFSFLLYFAVCSLCIRKFLSYKLQCPVCNMVSIDCWLSTAQCCLKCTRWTTRWVSLTQLFFLLAANDWTGSEEQPHIGWLGHKLSGRKVTCAVILKPCQCSRRK